MKQLIKDTLEKVFAIYNINLPDIDKSINLDANLDKNSHKRECIFKITDDHLEISIVIYKSKTADWYTVDYPFSRKIFEKKAIEFIGQNCLKTIISFSRVDRMISARNKSPRIIASAIDQTIELSIIALALVKDGVPPIGDARVTHVFDLLRELNKWSNRTYEGRKIPFSIIVNLATKQDNEGPWNKIKMFLKDDASALLTDGITSYFYLKEDITYNVAKHYDPESIEDTLPLVPYRFSSIGNICDNDNLGIILTVQGDVLFIRERKLFFAKRNGDWHFYNYDAFNEILFQDIIDEDNDPLHKRDWNEKIKKIYLTCLDVAFARTGGCLAICRKEMEKKLLTNVQKQDIHGAHFKNPNLEDYHHKRYFLENIVVNGRPFASLSRKARQELLGIDGATAIALDGRILTTGAIMNNALKNSSKNEDMHGGARTKITKKLSNYGIAIKISADGYIECYKNESHIY